jgi:hypothetical protein
MPASQDFFYDAQTERFLIQFIRIISGFQVQYGEDRDGNTTLQRVPVFYGDGSKQVAQIIANNSESSMPAVPAMTVYIDNLSYDRERIQEPNFVSKMHLRTREYNEQTQEYEATQGNAVTVERLMPVPYQLELKVDVWTSNTKQKLQLLEQLAVLFNPGLEVQSTDNYIDWGSLSIVYLDSQTWTSRSIPIGTGDPIDVATLSFKMPIWLSPPAKIKKMGVIHRIIANVHDSAGDLNAAILNDTNLLGARQYFTPLDYGVLLVGNTLELLKYSEFADPIEPTLVDQTKVGTDDLWRSLINIYGDLENGLSQVRLYSDNHANEIVGTVSFHPSQDELLIFNADIDTYPTNTLTNIDAIIDPRNVTVDANILTPATGTRYLILDSIGDSVNNPEGDGPVAWAGAGSTDLIAGANDIIEYDGSVWNVSFDSSADASVNYVSNLNTGTQYKWDEGTTWIKSFDGEYKSGKWALVL